MPSAESRCGSVHDPGALSQRLGHAGGYGFTGLDLGAVDYVTKPFDAFELCARVRAALRTKHLQDLLIEHAHIDPLTGLPNRRALMERLQTRMGPHRATRRPSLVHHGPTSTISSTSTTPMGHHIGDRMLQEVARALARQCRETDMPAPLRRRGVFYRGHGCDGGWCGRLGRALPGRTLRTSASPSAAQRSA